MATTVVLTAVVKDPAGPVRVAFADGTELEFSSLDQLRGIVTGPDMDVGLTRLLCIAYTLGRSADLSNVASTRNKNFTFDLTNNSPIRVQ